MATAYNLQISEGGIVKLLDVTSRNGEETYNNIKKKLRESDVVYADETGSREDGINGHQWSFSDDKYQLLWYQKKRNKDVVREFVGKEEPFEGIMVSDFLASYNEYNGFHQRCWVHLLSDIKELKKQYFRQTTPTI